ncbi:hypothetical protein NXA99_07230 [Citrobacter amalonaticus]|jgi:hypothetical protein|uniref:phage baseplate protein n=1 Tax=Citrobacter amalonaticus TaxID=35703 RepID=UPI00215BA211|nr:hypothetical protein [Citrobacter amalonaticus]MCR9028325.1 hypothetical protein [Citrobacter amalonaticus]
MSIVNIFSTSRPNINGISFDAVLNEQTELRTEISDYPLEDATTASDNAVTLPLSLIMTVGASDNLIKAATAEAGEFSGVLSAGIGVTAGMAASVLSGGAAALAGLGLTVGAASISAGTRARSATILDAIREIQRSNTIFTVITSKGEYSNMIISNTRQETNKENENGLELVVEMRQVTLINRQGDATTQNANLPVNDTATTQGQATVNIGSVALQ